MANPEDLRWLGKGVAAWNERRARGSLKPDLENARLAKAELTGIDLHAANLNGADLSGADLSKANVKAASARGANFERANLRNVDFSDTTLRQARLYEADLRGANLQYACLERAYLYRADMSGANLSSTNLHKADLTGVCLLDARLRKTLLIHADLNSAILRGLDLSSANLQSANLTHADLRGANLTAVSLRFCSLVKANLTGATLTGAKLYGTARDDWVIDSIECQYVFWDMQDEIRCPRDRDLAPGEFERLYRTLPIIEYIFQNGMSPMDPLIMDRVVQAIREQNPEFDIRVDSINARGLAPSIKFTVQEEQYVEAARAAVRREYETRVELLAAERDRYYQLIARAMDAPRQARLTVIESGAIAALDGSTININQHIEYVTNVRDAVAALPEDSPTFAKVAKKTALDIIGSALKDVAKGQVKKAAEQIIELGKDIGPVILDSAAHAFFKSCLGQ